MVVALVVIALLAAPCCCYFGAGIFFGINELRTGQYKNPARNPTSAPNRRDPRYDRQWDKPAPGTPNAPEAPWRGVKNPKDQ